MCFVYSEIGFLVAENTMEEEQQWGKVGPEISLLGPRTAVPGALSIAGGSHGNGKGVPTQEVVSVPDDLRGPLEMVSYLTEI